MVNPTTVHKIKPSLNGMVYCANCGAAMVHTGQRYYCPNTSVDSGRNCPTKPVHADHLRYMVVNELLNRLATDDAIQSITETIKETTNANADLQRQRMEQAEAAIAEANAKRPAFLQLVEDGDKTYQDVARRDRRIGPHHRRTRLRVHRRQERAGKDRLRQRRARHQRCRHQR